MTNAQQERKHERCFQQITNLSHSPQAEDVDIADLTVSAMFVVFVLKRACTQSFLYTKAVIAPASKKSVSPLLNELTDFLTSINLKEND